jgi:hypothetical protein
LIVSITKAGRHDDNASPLYRKFIIRLIGLDGGQGMDSESLLKQAERCFRLAGTIGDGEMIRKLEQLARYYEDASRRVELDRSHNDGRTAGFEEWSNETASHRARSAGMHSDD